MRNFKEQNKKQKGFSLVETLVAVFILALALSAAMTVAQNSLRASFFSRDRILANFLAQESIELVKNKRDRNGLSNQPWLNGFDDCLYKDQDSVGCRIDPLNFIVLGCGSDPRIPFCEICFDDDSKTFSYNSGFPLFPCSYYGDQEITGIVRKTFITPIKNDDGAVNEAEVRVEVTWDGNILEAKEHIYNWHPFSPLDI